ncbi:MAG: hypothetical protein Q8K93_21305 [Reyranella sp.]|nr:hypothetical protein [Reyranella sp.]
MPSQNKPHTPRIGDAFHSLVAIDGSFRQSRPSPEMEAFLRYRGLIECSPISRLPVRTPKGDGLVAAAMQGESPTDALGD